MSQPAVDLLARGPYVDLSRLLQLRLPARELRPTARRDSAANLGGAARTRFRGRGMEFEEVRLYQPGDDVRNIDWRVTARTTVTHTKVFREERERPTLVAVDQRASLYFGSQRCFKSVLAAHLASLLGWAALHNGDRVGGLVFGDQQHAEVRPRRSKRAALELLHHLHAFNERLDAPVAESLPLWEVLRNLRRIARPGTTLQLISDCHDFDERCAEELTLLARHTEPNLFLVSDPLEQTLPAKGLLTVSNGRHHLRVASGDRRLREAFRARYRNRVDSVAARCQSLRIPLYHFSTAEDEIQQLRRLFRGKGKRRSS